MNIQERQIEFLSHQVLPARLDVFQTAWFLGFKPHDIPVLAGAGIAATDSSNTFRRDQ
jgi:hypothetical protein